MNNILKQQLDIDKKKPDILTCIANLSNYEVYTSPELVDKVLDLLPEDVWRDSSLRWLDPACKTGVFLRQIASRLMVGLREEFPDEEERRQHIFRNMLFGIAITDLTAMMSRRSLYTSKNANSDKSVAKFDTPEGNISYDNRAHTYKNGSCIYCGNKEGDKLDRDETKERFAYKFIHLTEEEAKNMKFDIIVGNPPYQLNDGGHGASASPIYQLFVYQAKKIGPRYIAFIIPSRWFVGGKGLDSFRDEMLADRKIRKLVDYPNSADCFPGPEIKGGVCYFVRDEEYSGPCQCEIYHDNEIISSSKRYLNEGGAGVFIRYPEMLSILKKVQAKHEETMDSIISSRKPYGLPTDTFKNPKKYGLPYIYNHREEVSGAAIKIYGLVSAKRVEKFVPLGFPFTHGQESITGWKVFIPNAYGGGELGEVIPDPILANPPSACTETFLRIGNWGDEESAKNCIIYIKTKFFRFLMSIKKTTQHTSKDTYSFVPLLDMKQEWDDRKLYERYELSQGEIDFIERNVREMK